ncbi:phosphonate C-P lyase system protein PhnH [Methylovirgula sp. 4M-Z18]|uniref:phosphonate C-P lyase system protein PhnH n=1 Tax=Methylovirgula sp. 4M-Z18 TaxID=2293567 RepID=UPI000E2E7330|nr:phosphonate C-P lyase system protein PhnH [Methylovirgula sp. 4M-Z18]RFB81249.1 phosphonate C-P lyase system protein PhnH [Methylovirgula sp. 4M-Z18]
METQKDLTQGFAAPVFDAQKVFRAVLGALSTPGRIFALNDLRLQPPDELPLAAAAMLLTLADHETPVWWPAALSAGAAPRWLTFHTGARVARNVAEARFALLDGAADNPPLSAFDSGEDRYPDRAATLILLCSSLDGGEPVVLRGPGIDGSAIAAPQGLPADFWAQTAANQARFPLGVDFLFASGDGLFGLPRSTQISMPKGAA